MMGRIKTECRNIPERARIFPSEFRPQGITDILNQIQPVLLRKSRYLIHIAHVSEGMRNLYSPCTFRQGLLEQVLIDIQCIQPAVNKDRDQSILNYRRDSRRECKAACNNLVARP